MNGHGNPAARHRGAVVWILVGTGALAGCNGDDGDAGPVCGTTGGAAVGGAWSPELED